MATPVDTRERILDTAERLYAERGLDGVSMREIGEAAGQRNLFFDTAWWNTADQLALFSLIPPGQILFASDTPYGRTVAAATSPPGPPFWTVGRPRGAAALREMSRGRS